MSSGDDSIIDIPDEIEVEAENDNPIEIIETGEETGQNIEAKESDDEDKKVVKPKRVVRNPQPKLNEQTLRTKKGLSALPNHFKRVKFKGKGHEAHDLNVLMKTYEYWCHRLYPKFPFDACIARLETLGTKRGTQVILKKIRLGMDICDDDKKIVSDEEQEGETPTTEGFVDTFDNRFDQLLSGTDGTVCPAEPEATEEQLEKIRQNKLRAETLRKQRLEKIRANIQTQGNPSTSSNSQNVISATPKDTEIEKDPETFAQKKSDRNETSNFNDGSSDDEIVFHKSGGIKRTQVFSSDEEEEMHIDSEKPTNDSLENSIQGEKIQTIESDDETQITKGLDDHHSDTRIEIFTQGEKQSHAMEEDNEEVDLDNILSIVNEDAGEEQNITTDIVNKDNYTSNRRKKIQTIDSDDENEMNEKLNISTDDIPKESAEFDTNNTSTEDNLKEPICEPVEL